MKKQHNAQALMEMPSGKASVMQERTVASLGARSKDVSKARADCPETAAVLRRSLPHDSAAVEWCGLESC